MVVRADFLSAVFPVKVVQWVSAIRYIMVPLAAAVPSEDVVRGMAAAAEEEREAAAAAATGRQVERRKWREDQTELLDQLLPPATAGTGCVPPRPCPCSCYSPASSSSSSTSYSHGSSFLPAPAGFLLCGFVYGLDENR